MRWIWIDNFVAFQRGKSARAVKNLSLAEDYFADHFPGYPVMPGSLMIEGLAQTGGILVGEANDFKEKVVLAKINKAKFHCEALAGQRLLFDVELLIMRLEGASIKGRVYAQDMTSRPKNSDRAAIDPSDTLVVEAEIFFAHLDQNRSQQFFGDANFVFDGNLKKLLGLAKVMADQSDNTETQG